MRILVVLAASLLATGVAAKPASLGVLELRVAGKSDERAARLLEGHLVKALAAEHRGAVVGVTEVRAMLDAASAAALARCHDDRCTVDAARALALDLVVAGTFGRLGEENLLSLSLLEPKTGSVKARASVSMPAKGPLDPLAAGAAKALLHPDAARAGDQIFAELRTALLFEGQDEEGRPVPGGGVDACLKNRLLEAKVPLVSPEQIERIRAGFNPAARGEGREGRDVLDAVTAAHADVLLTGIAVYAQQGQRGSVQSWRADLDLQIVKVDTGEIIVAQHAEAIALGVTPAGASRAAAKKLCADVVPALERALERRYERGVRLQIELEGVEDASAAEAVASRLREASSLVADARVRRAKQGTAILEAITRGSDGVRLALALGETAPDLKILEAGPSALRIATR